MKEMKTMKEKRKELNTREILTGPADVDAIYQVLKQAGEIRGNSTNSPPTPPTADHPPSGAAPSSARTTTSSQPCSSSTSGKTNVPPFLTFESISLSLSLSVDVVRLLQGVPPRFYDSKSVYQLCILSTIS